jgi:hypothetical protein
MKVLFLYTFFLDLVWVREVNIYYKLVTSLIRGPDQSILIGGERSEPSGRLTQ